MTTAIESFLVLEKSLSNRISRQWQRNVASTMNQIIAHVSRGEFEKAMDLCPGLSLAETAENNQRFTEFVGMQATLFGASRLTQGHPSRTKFIGNKQPEEVGQASEAMVGMLATEASEAVCRLANELISEERAAQQDAAYKSDLGVDERSTTVYDVDSDDLVRKDATTGFIRRFTTNVDTNGKAFINLGSSLHTSRLSAWGFTQEANFRGISEYQVSEQLDNRTCPVCSAMHGRRFTVAPAAARLESQMSVQRMSELKSIAPWPKQDAASVKGLRQMSNSRITQNGWDTPPYHPLCRGVLVAAGSFKEKLPEPVTPRDATVDPFREPYKTTNEYYERFDNPGQANVEAVLARHNPEAADIIRGYEERIAVEQATKGDTFTRYFTGELDAKGKLVSGGFTAEREAEHLRIINKFLSPEDIARATPAAGEQPVVVLLGGRGGSGKTFLTEGVDKAFYKKNGYGKGAPIDIRDKIVLNSDLVKAAMPEYEGWNAAIVHRESSYLLKEIERRSREMGLNVIIDGTLQGVAKQSANILKYTEANYAVEGYYMHLPRHEAAFRAVFRSIKKDDPRYVPLEIILTNVDNEAAFDNLTKLFRRWGVWDNQVPNGTLPRHVTSTNLPKAVDISNSWLPNPPAGAP